MPINRRVHANDTADAETPRRLFVFSGGLFHGPVANMLRAAGYHLTTGWPDPKRGDLVGVWGASPTAKRGLYIARRAGVGVLRIEDAFLRSVLPARVLPAYAGAWRSTGTPRHLRQLARRAPLGLMMDDLGLHWDASRPSRIESLAQTEAARDAIPKARAAIARLKAAHLSKYNGHDPDLPGPEGDYVLVIDQVRGDAALMGAGRVEFLAMLDAARAQAHGRKVVVRSHPETVRNLRPGHFALADLRTGEVFCDAPISPWRLFEGASSVHVWSSQMGFEAILAGCATTIHGTPFYAGWGLGTGRDTLPRRAPLPAEQLFAASYMLATTWVDPLSHAPMPLGRAIDQLEAEVRAYREDHTGHLAFGISKWKRPSFSKFFGQGGTVRYTEDPSDAITLAWGTRINAQSARSHPGTLRRVEDGFIRSKGLGAALTPPLSLIADPVGLHFDPTHPSGFEALLDEPLPPEGHARARDLAAILRRNRIGKYNLSHNAPDLPPRAGRRRILVPGQVADDASVRLGGGGLSLGDLLMRTRAENPDAFIIWKPHPDVEAGLRKGALPAEIEALADMVARDADPIALLENVDEVWTLTSTLGFEALIREVPVTTLGAPFYAGWGLTRDLGAVPARRTARPDLATLLHAALIGYPRYHDPVTNRPIPVEAAIWRLTQQARPLPLSLRLLSRAQSTFAPFAHLWR